VVRLFVVAAAASAIHADLGHHEWLQPDAQRCRPRWETKHDSI